jgi:hypothetical protein
MKNALLALVLISFPSLAYAGDKDDLVFSQFPVYMGYYFLVMVALFLLIQRGKKQ